MPGKFYFAEVSINHNKRYKFGITTQTAFERLSKEFKEFRLIRSIKNTLYKCYLIARGILNIFSSYRDKTIKSEQLDGYSEIFNLPDELVNRITVTIDDNFSE